MFINYYSAEALNFTMLFSRESFILQSFICLNVEIKFYLNVTNKSHLNSKSSNLVSNLFESREIGFDSVIIPLPAVSFSYSKAFLFVLASIVFAWLDQRDRFPPGMKSIVFSIANNSSAIAAETAGCIQCWNEFYRSMYRC